MRVSFSFFLFQLAVCFAEAQYARPFQLWNIDEFSYSCSARFRLSVNQEMHWADNVTLLHYHHTELRSSFKFTDIFSAGFDFRHVCWHDNFRYNEERPQLAVDIRLPLGNIVLFNRTKAEYRMFNERRDHLRMVNRTMLFFPFSSRDREYQPYLSVMPYYTPYRRAFDMLRFYFGIIHFLNDHFSLDLCALYIGINRNRWNYFYVFSLSLKYTIG